MKKRSSSIQKLNTVDGNSSTENRKKITQNASSVTYFSANCIAPPQTGYTFDIKTVTLESLVKHVSTLFNINSSNIQEYKGPQAINEWILDNLAKEKITVKELYAFLASQKNKHPFGFYDNYKFIIKFLQYVALMSHVSIQQIQKEMLTQKETFISFAKQTHITPKKFKLLSKMFTLFFPKLELSDFIHCSHSTKNFVIDHPTITACNKSAKKYGITESTMLKNNRHYTKFLIWLKNTFTEFSDYNLNFLPLFKITSEHLVEFRHHLIRKVQREEISQRYASDVFYTVRALFARMHQMKLTIHDIAEQVNGIEFDKYVYRKIPSDMEISHLLEISDIYSPNPKLYRLAFSLMLFLGFRPQEMSELKWKDINLETQKISVLGKGKATLLPLPAVLTAQFKELTPTDQKGFVFHSNPKNFKNKLLDFYTLFKLIASWNEYPGGLYLFRHTFITRLSEQNQYTPQVIMYLARHERPESTSLYIHREEKVLRMAINQLYFKTREEK
ncbi:tyrosine-type recombinase/integrase [Aneurinibacillus migulanus]|uniref:Phage integrase family protein n=1 Tax=Aneurinibacillus migulanus TaxID=47500 RepID=A0A0D1XES3_ANEMI|nr:site-specific integrase [Aneurinibacillus migulanus]KIV52901.1 hypothetical protein TS65_22645 [Aneurinibacillus migulanus]KON95178.1 hypothetical protein AF333_06485 [Aneurinibacillus migulanus]MED0890913.1 site-specific integrase [Aneurinibacillus migulanus]MED1616605.1 site-specific integrase [Aneurinibacillus migulanus]SDI82431.1 Phage integrase family protein [Aneurinibacillus migulanus]